MRKTQKKNALYLPDYTVGRGISPRRAFRLRGLYRRWGISPRPETDFNHIINHAKKKSSLAVFFYPKIERPTFIEL